MFRALAGVDSGARVLDVGASESSVCLSLATLGYQVTAIDPRPNPLSHERLEVVEGRIEDWDHDGEFDAVICLSTIEHLGVGAYEQEASDRQVDLEAIERMRELTRLGGLLVLTTSVGADRSSASMAGFTTVRSLTAFSRAGPSPISRWFSAAIRRPGSRSTSRSKRSAQTMRLSRWSQQQSRADHADPHPLRHPGAPEPVVGGSRNRPARPRAGPRARALASGARPVVRDQPRSPRASGGRGRPEPIRTGAARGRPKPRRRRDLPHPVAVRALLARAPLAGRAAQRASRRDASRPDPGRLPHRADAGSRGAPSLLGPGRARSPGRSRAECVGGDGTGRGAAPGAAAENKLAVTGGGVSDEFRPPASRTDARRRAAGALGRRSTRNSSSTRAAWTTGRTSEASFRRTQSSLEGSATGSSSWSLAGSGSRRPARTVR